MCQYVFYDHRPHNHAGDEALAELLDGVGAAPLDVAYHFRAEPARRFSLWRLGVQGGISYSRADPARDIGPAEKAGGIAAGQLFGHRLGTNCPGGGDPGKVLSLECRGVDRQQAEPVGDEVLHAGGRLEAVGGRGQDDAVGGLQFCSEHFHVIGNHTAAGAHAELRCPVRQAAAAELNSVVAEEDMFRVGPGLSGGLQGRLCQGGSIASFIRAAVYYYDFHFHSPSNVSKY